MMDRLLTMFFVSLALQYFIVQAREEQHLQLLPNVEYLIPVDFQSPSYSDDNYKNTHTFRVQITDDGSCLVFFDAFDIKKSITDFRTSRESKQLRKHAVNIARDFCRGYNVVFKNIKKSDEQLDFSSDLDTNEIVISRRKRDLVRRRRAASTTVFKALPRGRYRGQTQSQYLNFGDQVAPGKAEAESTHDGSRASVSGTNGMGQAQSQSGFSNGCDGCYDNPDVTQSQTILAGGPTNLNGRYPTASAGQGIGKPQNIGINGAVPDYGQTHPSYKYPYAPSREGGGQTETDKYPDHQNPSVNIPPGSSDKTTWRPGGPILDYPQGPPTDSWDSRKPSLSPGIYPSGEVSYRDHGKRPFTDPEDYQNKYPGQPEHTVTHPDGGRDSYGENGKIPPTRPGTYPPRYPDTLGSTGRYPDGERDPYGGSDKMQPTRPDTHPPQYPDTSGSTGRYPDGGRDSFGGNGKTQPIVPERYPGGERDSYGGKDKIPPTRPSAYPPQYPDTSGSTGRYPGGDRDSFGENGKIPPTRPSTYPPQYPDTSGSTGRHPDGGRDSYGGSDKIPPTRPDTHPPQYPDTSGSTGRYPGGERDSFGGNGQIPPTRPSTYPPQYPDTSGSHGRYPGGDRDSYGGNGKIPPSQPNTYPSQYPDTSGSTGRYPGGERDSFGGNGKIPPTRPSTYPPQYPDTSGSTGRYPGGDRDSFGGNGKIPPTRPSTYPPQYPDTSGSTGRYPGGDRDSYGGNGKIPPSRPSTYPSQYPDTSGSTGRYPGGERDSYGGNDKIPPTRPSAYPPQYPDTSGSTGRYPSGGRDPYGGSDKMQPTRPDTHPPQYPDTSGSTGRYPDGGRDSFGGNGKTQPIGPERYPGGERDSYGGKDKIPPTRPSAYPPQYPNTSGSTGRYPGGDRDSFGENGKIPPTRPSTYPPQYPDTSGSTGRYPGGDRDSYGGNGKIPPSRPSTYPSQYPDTSESTGRYPGGERDSYGGNGKIPPTGPDTYFDRNRQNGNSYDHSTYPLIPESQNVNYPDGGRQDNNGNTYYPDSQKPGGLVNKPHVPGQNGYSGQLRPNGHESYGEHQQPGQNQFSPKSPSEYTQPDHPGYGPNTPRLPSQAGDSNLYDPRKYPLPYPDQENNRYPGTYRDPSQDRKYPPDYTPGQNLRPSESQKGPYYPTYPGSPDQYPSSYDTNGRQEGGLNFGSTDTQAGGGKEYIANQYTDNIEDTNSQAETSIQQLHNETKASALSSGKQGGGTAQSQITGSYSGSGSFSAQAQTIDAHRGAQTQISVGGKGATSSAQGNAGYGQSQAQLQLGSENGATIAGAQSGGWNHGTNTIVEASSKGGMADAQANGPGSTSSQAQIGFQPYQESKNRNEDNKPGSPFYGGGTASAQSGNYAGQSQTQIQGKFKYGLSYNGAAQAGSGGKDGFFKNKTIIKPLDIFSAKPVIAEISASPQAQFSAMNTGIPLDEGMVESESKNIERTHFENSDGQVSNSGLTSLGSTKKIRHSKMQGEPTYAEVKEDDKIMDEYDNEEGDDDEDYDLDYYPSTEASQQKSQSMNSPRDVVVQQSGHGQRQHIILGPLDNNGAKVVQDSSQKGLLKEGMLFQPGEVIPGTQGYTIPIGFRGRVSSVSDGDDTFAYTDENGESQAQTITLTPGSGNITYSKSDTKSQPTVRSWSPNYRYVHGPATHRRYMNRYNLKSNNNGETPEQYVTVTKTVAGELDSDKNNLENKKYAHTYYTKSSTCGYFTFSCNLVYGSNGRTKICKPKAPLNPDGTPVQC